MVANLDRIVPPAPVSSSPGQGRPWFVRCYATRARMSMSSHFCIEANGQYAEAGAWVIEDENIAMLQADAAFRENFETREGGSLPSYGELSAAGGERLSDPIDVLMKPIVVQPVRVAPYDDRHETYVGVFVTSEGGRIELHLDKFGVFFSRCWFDPGTGQYQNICSQAEPLSIQARELINELDCLCSADNVIRFKLDGLDHQRSWASGWDESTRRNVEQVVLHLRDLVAHARALLHECGDIATQQVADMTYVLFERTSCAELLKGLPCHTASDQSVSSSTIRALGMILSMGGNAWAPHRISSTAPDPSADRDPPPPPGRGPGLEPA